MSEFTAFLKDIEVADHREKMEGLFEWIDSRFPELKRVVKWNQPMYTTMTHLLSHLVKRNIIFLLCQRLLV